MTLLDATYKTTKYTLPLFLLCVRTNNGYIPVAEFIVEQTGTSIAEALHIIAGWNNEWKPPCFMVDYSEAELNAILSVFPSADVYLCEFHREQAWTRWIRNGTYYVHLDMPIFKGCVFCRYHSNLIVFKTFILNNYF